MKRTLIALGQLSYLLCWWPIKTESKIALKILGK